MPRSIQKTGMVLAFLCAERSQRLGEALPGSCQLSWMANGHKMLHRASQARRILSLHLSTDYKKIWPLSSAKLWVFLKDATHLTKKQYFHEIATEENETERNVLSFRSREDDPGHLQEDLQNKRRSHSQHQSERASPWPGWPLPPPPPTLVHKHYRKLLLILCSIHTPPPAPLPPTGGVLAGQIGVRPVPA